MDFIAGMLAFIFIFRSDFQGPVFFVATSDMSHLALRRSHAVWIQFIRFEVATGDNPSIPSPPGA